MKYKLLRLYWSIVGRPDLPPKNFIIKPRINCYTGDPYIPRYTKYASLWLDGNTIEEIAERTNVTRERVRQCIWKAYHEAHRGVTYGVD